MTKHIDKSIFLFSLFAVISMACNRHQPTPIESHEKIESNEEIEDTSTVIPKKDTVYSLKISAVGDLMVHDYQILKAHRSDTDSFDFSPVFKQVQPYLDEADILLGNLETVFAGKDNGRSNKVLGYSSFPYFNSPNAFAETLAEAGFDLVTTANNHTLDAYAEGVVATLNLLDSLGIRHVGTARDSAEKQQLCLIEKNGILVGFSGYTYSLNGIRRPKDKPYLVNEFVNYDTIKTRKMCDEIRLLKAAGADFVVAYVHAGTEYQKNHNVYQRRVADSLFHAGAQLIVMSHPHILQKMDVLTSKDSLQKSLVAYSLGNFISSQVGTESTFKDIGAILEVEVKKWKDTTFISAVSVIPTYSYWRKDHIGVLPVIKAHDSPNEVIKLWKKDTMKVNKAYHHTLEVLRGDMDSTLWKIEDERYCLEWR